MSACPKPKSKMPKPYHDDGKGIIIYCGDSRIITPLINGEYLQLCDPPYGLKEGNRKRILSRGKLANPIDYGHSEWDNVAPDWIGEIIALAKNAIVFGGNYFSMHPSKCWLVWDKENGGNDFADAELAWTNLDMAVRLKRYRWAGMLQGDMKNKEVRFHPTQKPVPVMEWCIQLAQPKMIVDSFMGSGTTLVAAKNLGIPCIGIEQEKKYCDIAIKRLAQEVLPL
jgi:hypothetical protein